MEKTTELAPKKKAWRWGTNRWIVLACIIGSVIATYVLGIKPVRPVVQLPAEKLTISCQPLILLPAPFGSKAPDFCLEAAKNGEIATPATGFYLTNTLVALILVDVILLIIGFGFYRYAKSGTLVPKGFSSAVEALLEAIYNLTEGTAGKWTKTFFPWFATITLLVLLVNWMELIPGVDSIGLLVKVAHGGNNIQQLTNGIASITPAAKGEVLENGYVVVPFVRVVSTDLNFTLALALVAVVMVQIMGVRAQKGAYFTKFWNTKTLFSKPLFGVIDFLVGLLESVSEFSKVLSFSFRLLGNIFAGSMLLFVIGWLVPVFAQSGILMLEFFIGMIQAIVFGMLAMTFMTMATQSHSGEDHKEAHT